MRKKAWVVLGASLLTGSLAQAQGPMPAYPPGPSGVPGYGNPAPGMPYAMPTSRPTIPPMGPFTPNYPGMQPPAYDGNGPKAGAAEPYLVPTAPSQTPAPGSAKKVLTLPPADAPGVVTGPAYPVEPLEPIGPPAEPYTVYEGPRSLAEVKQDDTHVWVQTNFVHWWIRRDSTPPLVSTGSLNSPGPGTVGALGNPDTVILLGNGSIGPTEFSGVQASLGVWLDDEHLNGVEASGFWLAKNSRQYTFGSDARGNPIIAQPIIEVGFGEQGLPISSPGLEAGRISVYSVLSLGGAEVNFTHNLLRTGGFTFDVLAGLRYLYLNDTMSIDQNLTALVGGFVPFYGRFEPAGSAFVLNDSFNVTNRYAGGQVGARVDWAWRNLDVNALLKIGAGDTNHLFVINGSSTLTTVSGAISTVPGGTLTQLSNIGRYSSNDFSVVPELTVTIGYQVTPSLRVTAGYTLLYWSNVMRVGNNIDRNLDAGQVPTGSNGPITPGTQPAFPAIRTEFWAQGVNVGMELKY